MLSYYGFVVKMTDTRFHIKYEELNFTSRILYAEVEPISPDCESNAQPSKLIYSSPIYSNVALVLDG